MSRNPHQQTYIQKIFENFLDQIFGPQPRFYEPCFAPRMIPYLHGRKIPIMPYQSILSMHPLAPNIRAIVHEIKFFKNPYALTLCTHSYIQGILWLAQRIQAYDIYLIPLPMSKKRLLQKGYNQCEYIVQELLKQQKSSLELTKATFHYAPLLIKPYHTRQQAKLNREERTSMDPQTYSYNTDVAHSIHRKIQTVERTAIYIIIDDITTTGATLRAALTVLKHALEYIYSSECDSKSKQTAKPLQQNYTYCALTYAYTQIQQKA
jgi:predicted amidophosphoribosyltransferase